MLHLLTKYLFQYKTVAIPHVGTLQLNCHPAQLNIVGKSIAPPSFFIELKGTEEVPEHQLNFLESFLQVKRDEIWQDLKAFGASLHEKINGPGFQWDGLGLITQGLQTLPVAVTAMQPVTAEKVTRPDAEHQILVGDQHRTSAQMTERRTFSNGVVKKKSWYVLAAWILLIVSVLAIIFFLYTGKFKVNAVGLKQNPLGYNHYLSKTFL